MKYILPILFCAGAVCFAQSESLALAQRHLDNENYEDAMILYEDLVNSLEEVSTSEVSEILYGYARSADELKRSSLARSMISIHLEAFPYSEYTDEMKYRLARLDLEEKSTTEGLLQMNDFLKEYPDSKFFPDALFWVAERFYALGYYDDSYELYRRIIIDYPEHPYVKEARSRQSLIVTRQSDLGTTVEEQQRTENELRLYARSVENLANQHALLLQQLESSTVIDKEFLIGDIQAMLETIQLLERQINSTINSM